VICTLTARRLKPGAADQFRDAFDVDAVLLDGSYDVLEGSDAVGAAWPGTGVIAGGQLSRRDRV
jgi:hypothetical protein